MYKIDVDKDNKIINIELSGYMQLKEMETIITEVFDHIRHFKKKEVLILALLERLDPVSQDTLKICIESLTYLSVYTKKIAFVHKRVVTRMQQERAVDAVNAIKGFNLQARCFNTKKDALKFLLE